METKEPYLNADEHIPELLKEWELLKVEIKALFDARDNKVTLTPMKKGIELLLQFVFCSNGLPLSDRLSEKDDATLVIKPVNFFERVQFLMNRPNLYPSYIQLCELFMEQQKQYSKFLALQKSKQK